MKKSILFIVLTVVSFPCLALTSLTTDLIVGIEQGKLKKVSDSLAEADINVRYNKERNTPLIQAVSVFIKDRATCRTISKAKIGLFIGGLTTTAFFMDKYLLAKKASQDLITTPNALNAPLATLLIGVLTGGLAANIVYTLCKPSSKRLKERFAIIELLIKSGADVTAVNNSGQTVQTIMEQCLVDHAHDQYLVEAMKALNDLLNSKVHKTIFINESTDSQTTPVARNA